METSPADYGMGRGGAFVDSPAHFLSRDSTLIGLCVYSMCIKYKNTHINLNRYRNTSISVGLIV